MSSTIQDVFQRLLTPLWLRPERALWDAHELFAVRRMLGPQFECPALEFGCTEGVNTFIMLDGEFETEYDDYEDLVENKELWPLQAESLDSDYFSTFGSRTSAAIKRPAQLRFDVGVSWRQAHLEKSRRLSIYDELHLVELNAPLTPLQSGKFRTIWSPNLFWTEPDYLLKVISEHARVLDANGRILTIVPDRLQITSNIWKNIDALPINWRNGLDRNISHNLSKNAKSDVEWRDVFDQCGLAVTDYARFLPRIVGQIYQIGLRPMFPVLLQMYSALKKCPPAEFLEVKRHWIDTVYHFFAPFCDLPPSVHGAHPDLWHIYELRHAR